MEASGEIRNPSPTFLDILEKDAAANNVALDLVSALAKMRSAEAHKRIEKWFVALKEPDYQAVAAYFFIEVRNEPGIVAMCNSVLRNRSYDAGLQNTIARVLFHDDPMEWLSAGTGGNRMKPPPRYEASTQVLEEQLKIAGLCIVPEFSSETKGFAKKASNDIKGILDFRQRGGPAQVNKHIRQLQSSTYSEREAATRILEKYGSLAEPGLRDAAKGKLSLESLRRIQQLLAKIEIAQSKISESAPGSAVSSEEATKILFPRLAGEKKR
jgi:hypothetical protein